MEHMWEIWNMYKIEDDFKMHLRSELQEYARIPVAVSNRRLVACINIYI
jgi:hypothetical protein